MGVLSTQASNAIIYLTYAAFLYVHLNCQEPGPNSCDRRIVGCYIAWRLRNQSKTEWLSSNRTQKGQHLINRSAGVHS